ncbi:MAG: flagellar assembly protein FliH [Leptospirales bacterium]|nr:flagellar assembly protein FliH [Leptospirales bacterium]
MSKLVFKPNQVKHSFEEKQIELPSKYLQNLVNVDDFREFEVDELGNPINLYKGPSIEEMEAELERYRRETEEEVNEMLRKANEQASSIIENAKQTSFNELQKTSEEATRKMEQFKADSEREVEKGRFEAEKIIKEAELKASEIEHEAYKRGHELGRDEGYKDGQSEVMRLIDRLATVLAKAVDVRDEIIHSSEKLMTDMILMISRKVIKDEIVERREVVINNIKESIKRIKDRDRIDIRVNFADLDMTTAHKDEIIKMMETIKKINIYEDSRVERGGCIIETDIGAVDARISTQLDIIEEAIRNTATI